MSIAYFKKTYAKEHYRVFREELNAAMIKLFCKEDVAFKNDDNATPETFFEALAKLDNFPSIKKELSLSLIDVNLIENNFEKWSNLLQSQE